MTAMKIGVIGLGRMGRPMAQHMVRAGHSVYGYDPRMGEIFGGETAGIALRGSPALVGAEADLTFLVVGFDDEVLEACLGRDGVFSTARSGSIVAICSTVRVETIITLDSSAAEHGIAMLDAPLCRAEHAAVSADLLVLVGGDRETHLKAEPVMRAFATDIAYLGGLGAGQVGKMVNNYVLWATVVANYEGLRLGQAAGLELEPLRQALLLSSADNWALETWRKGRPMPWAEKDMTIVLEAAGSLGLDLPLADSVRVAIAEVRGLKERWRTSNGVAPGGDADSMDAFMSATAPEVRH